MDRKRMVRSLAALGAGVLLVAAAGCAGGAEPSSSDGSSAPTTTATLPPVLEVELKTLISREDVETATGKTFGEPQLYDEDTNIHFTAEDKSVVDVHMAEGTREDFDAITTAYGELTDAPNLGANRPGSCSSTARDTCSPLPSAISLKEPISCPSAGSWPPAFWKSCRKRRGWNRLQGKSVAWQLSVGARHREAPLPSCIL